VLTLTEKKNSTARETGAVIPFPISYLVPQFLANNTDEIHTLSAIAFTVQMEQLPIDLDLHSTCSHSPFAWNAHDQQLHNSTTAYVCVVRHVFGHQSRAASRA
jgi:hypothetical protein